jgi:hypothetical protein
MTVAKNPMEIYRLLDRSNCRECNEATCMAFAAAVYTGKRRLDECARAKNSSFRQVVGRTENRTVMEANLDATVARLRTEVSRIDLASSAKRLEGAFCGGKLTVKVFGKHFGVDGQGNLYSDIHIHPWVTIPILSYIIDCTGVPVSGLWVPFRELRGGKDWHRLFGQRCERPLKKIADEHPELFEDMMDLFNGRQANQYDSDISIVLYPLPKMPMLISYWKPDDGLDSQLSLFFDSTAEDNLNVESLYALGTGLVRMFEKIALRHAYAHRDIL